MPAVKYRVLAAMNYREGGAFNRRRKRTSRRTMKRGDAQPQLVIQKKICFYDSCDKQINTKVEGGSTKARGQLRASRKEFGKGAK